MSAGFCPRCGSVVQPQWRFCMTCGAPRAVAPPPTPWAPASGPRADFGQRAGAYVIDLALIIAIDIVVVGGTLIAGFSLATTTMTPLAVVVLATGYLALLLVPLGYFTIFEGDGRGQTVGKRALGIRVVRFSDGSAPTRARALGRAAARALSGTAWGLGYLWCLWDPESRTWHDMLADTVVVPLSYYPIDTQADRHAGRSTRRPIDT